MRPLGTLFRTQETFLRTFLENDKILVLKARQEGLTTIAILALLWWCLRLPQGGGVLQLTHESEAVASLNEKLRTVLENLPKALRPRIARDTAKQIGVGQVVFTQRMAGGRSQGRSFSYQHQHYTEMAFYPQGSASVKGRGVDRQVWASVNATVRKIPGVSKTIVESTANGPGGLFAELCAKAQKSKEWAFLFFPWFYTRKYTKPIPDGWELNDEEEEMLRLYAAEGLTVEHLVWRRSQLEDELVDIDNFRREYPSNRDEPFLVTGSQFFPTDVLRTLEAFTAKETAKDDIVLFEQPEADREYYGGFDTSGGTGRDFASLYVLRDDGKLVARWRSATTSPHNQAEIGAKLSGKYNRALTCVEGNKYGLGVWNEMRRLGANVWSKDGKPFWMQRGNLATKDEVLAFARGLLQRGVFSPQSEATGDEAAPTRMEPWLFCPHVVQELSIMQEDDKGNIQAPEGFHDDAAIAWVLAVWCARDRLRARATPRLWTPDEARAYRAKMLREFVTRQERRG